MRNTLLSKSWRDLKLRKVRSIFTVLTIVFGVAALGMFAVIPLLDRAMMEEISSSNMHDVVLRFNDTAMNESVLQALENLDGVDLAEAMSILFTKMFIGERRNIACIVGVPDLKDMSVDRISLEDGRAPEIGHGQILTERANAEVGLFRGAIGDGMDLYDAFGNVKRLEITGVAHNPHFSGMPFGQVAVFYTNIETIHWLANTTGYNFLALDVDGSNTSVAIDRVAECLSQRTSFDGYTQMPQVRKAGEWPLKELFENVGTLFNMIAYIVLFCALFLISNTMHTIITEQRREVAQMKAIGATRAQVVASYLTTSLIMGVTGSFIGSILGMLIAIGMASVFGTMVGIQVGIDVHLPTVILGFIVGCAVTVSASLPAVLMALRVPVREGLEGCGLSSSFGFSVLDRIMMRMATLPMIARMGFRNVSRRKGRSISTMLQVALAVGMLLGVVTSCVAMSDEIEREFSCVTYDIQTTGQEDGANPLTDDVGPIIEGIPGVMLAEPYVSTMVRLDDHDTLAQAYPCDTKALDTDKAICSGRWFSETEGEALVVVINNRVASSLGVSIGEKVPIQTRAGTITFEVVGIGIQVNVEVYMPLGTVKDVLGYGAVVSGFNILTESKDHASIDRVSTLVEDTLVGQGYLVNGQVWYATEEQSKQGAQTTVIMMIASGALIVIVTMIGLMSMITMNVVERTREIGILRCLGSSSSSVITVFGSEGIVVAFGGWVLGLPTGYLVQMLLTWTISSSSGMDIAYIYPLPFVLASLFATLLITLLIIQPPLWRAGHFRPGDALRYQ